MMNDTRMDRVVHHVTHNLEFTRDGSRLLSTTSNDILRTYDVPAKMMVGPSKEEEEEEEEQKKTVVMRRRTNNHHHHHQQHRRHSNVVSR